MNRIITTLLIFLSPFAISWATPDAPMQNSDSQAQLLGFQEWKKNQVFDARKNLDEFKSPQLSKMAESEIEQNTQNVEKSGDISQAGNSQSAEEANQGNPEDSQPESGSAEQSVSVDEKAEKLRQLEFNLEIAQGLTIHDYFALYLKNKTKEEMAVAIKKLSPEELSELLIAYRKSLYGLPDQSPASKTALQ